MLPIPGTCRVAAIVGERSGTVYHPAPAVTRPACSTANPCINEFSPETGHQTLLRGVNAAEVPCVGGRQERWDASVEASEVDELVGVGVDAGSPVPSACLLAVPVARAVASRGGDEPARAAGVSTAALEVVGEQVPAAAGVAVIAFDAGVEVAVAGAAGTALLDGQVGIDRRAEVG